VAALDAADNDADARAAGVSHAARLSRDLLDAGAPGIHVITFNRHEAALGLVRELRDHVRLDRAQ
jgi:methylenetetrahydrofolate reductase (NADPH)